MAAKKGNEYTLKEALAEMLKTYRLDTRLSETQVVNAWEKVMGAIIAKYTKEVRMRDGVLYVTMTSATVKNELSYRRTEIAQQLNAECGSEIVKEVVITG
jgi:predicted nucleic acid-binding Zn ribbon protein